MLLSLVTINFNSSTATICGVRSLQKALQCVDYDFEIIVVDNFSRKDDFDKLFQLDGIKLIRNEKNGGFAYGNNVGIKAASGEFIMIINNDAVVNGDIFTPMIEQFRKDEKLGAISPKILYNTPPYIIQYGGYSCSDPYLFNIKSVLHGRVSSEVEDVAMETDFAHGAAMMLPRTMIDAVGLMREDYFLYFEEIDYSLAIRNGGYNILYYPFSVVYHDASASVGSNSPLKIYYNSRNRLLLAKNNLCGVSRVVAIALQLGFSLPKSVAKFLLRGEFSLAAAYLRGVFCAISKFFPSEEK